MRLRRSTPYGAGIRRVRRGRGFSYADENGVPVTDPEVTQRIDALVIPPAWRKVWICPQAQGHIQAVGVDAAGRRQYLYHEQWRRERDEEKSDRMTEVAEALGNTPTVARNSYVDPRVIEAWERGRTIAAASRRARRAPSEDERRAVVERAVLRLLRSTANGK